MFEHLRTVQTQSSSLPHLKYIQETHVKIIVKYFNAVQIDVHKAYRIITSFDKHLHQKLKMFPKH